MILRSKILSFASVVLVAGALSAPASAKSISLDGYDLSNIQDVDRLHRVARHARGAGGACRRPLDPRAGAP